MEKKKQRTKVIFRKFKDGDIIALFPEIATDMSPELHCLSYQHVGQHGAASIHLADRTKPCTFQEILPLWKELNDLGYYLERLHCFNAVHTEKRIAYLERVAG